MYMFFDSVFGSNFVDRKIFHNIHIFGASFSFKLFELIGDIDQKMGQSQIYHRA